MTSTRILAVRGTPPEASPGGSVNFDLLVGSPAGTLGSPPADWSFCASPNPPSNNNIISSACLASSGVTSIGGPVAAVSTSLLGNACSIFGPDIPPALPGQLPLQPPEPDVTGGYYQPVRIELSGIPSDGVATFGLERLACGLANASVEVTQQFNMEYTPNNNPVLSSVTAAANGATPTAVIGGTGEEAPLPVPRGASVNLVAGWPASSAETFPVYNELTYALSTQRESLRVSWFATAGQFAADITGRAGTDMATTTSNGWSAQDASGVVHFWVVLRDSRGGVDFGAFDLTIGG